MNRRKLFVCAAAFLFVAALAIVVAPPARAYGSTALWQIGLSFNCNNQALCLTPPFGIGGFWGWIEFDTGGKGEATLAGCSHLSTSLGVLTGADSIRIDITSWTPVPFGPGLVFVITGGTFTVAGVNSKSAPSTFDVASMFPSGFFTGIPAAPGHYTFTSLMGFTAPPGISFQVQVVAVG